MPAGKFIYALSPSTSARLTGFTRMVFDVEREFQPDGPLPLAVVLLLGKQAHRHVRHPTAPGCFLHQPAICGRRFEKNTDPNGPIASPLPSGPIELFGTCAADRDGGQTSPSARWKRIAVSSSASLPSPRKADAVDADEVDVMRIAVAADSVDFYHEAGRGTAEYRRDSSRSGPKRRRLRVACRAAVHS